MFKHHLKRELITHAPKVLLGLVGTLLAHLCIAQIAIPGTIQAESYSGMAGVQVETTTDAGGGQNVGWIDAND